MARPKLSVKHIQIDKANKAVIVAIAVAVAVLVFGVFIGRAMLLRQNHQSRVITEKEKAVKQLEANVKAKDQIVEAYQVFTSNSVNVLGGSTSPTATGDKDGDNARLVLDALPSKYDYPALATSIEKMLTDNGLTIGTIDGVDDEVNQSAVEPSANPETVEVPFGLTVIDTNYVGAQKLISLLETSIRPFKIKTLQIAGGEDLMQIQIEATTYYQPEKTLIITKKEIK